MMNNLPPSSLLKIEAGIKTEKDQPVFQRDIKNMTGIENYLSIIDQVRF
jgi:hypothetical protein